MVIYYWPSGNWVYAWEAVRDRVDLTGSKALNIDDAHRMNLTTQEVNICIEAVNEAESRSRELRNRFGREVQ